MKITLNRLTPRLGGERIHAFVDVEYEELKLKFKGIKVWLGKKKLQASMPKLLIEGTSVVYSPVLFMTGKDANDFLKEVIRIVMEVYPLSEWSKGIYQRKYGEYKS